MINIDLYSDYVGELKIVFLEKNFDNEIIFKVDLWYADFTSLMGYIPLQPNMHQDSVVYNWQEGVGLSFRVTFYFLSSSLRVGPENHCGLFLKSLSNTS